MERNDQTWKYALFSTTAVKSLITLRNEAITLVMPAAKQTVTKIPTNRKTAARACRPKLLMLLGDGPERSPDFGGMNPTMSNSLRLVVDVTERSEPLIASGVSGLKSLRWLYPCCALRVLWQYGLKRAHVC